MKCSNGFLRAAIRLSELKEKVAQILKQKYQLSRQSHTNLLNLEGLVGQNEDRLGVKLNIKKFRDFLKEQRESILYI